VGHPATSIFQVTNPRHPRALDVAEKLSRKLWHCGFDSPDMGAAQRHQARHLNLFNGETAERIRDLGISGPRLEGVPQRLPQGRCSPNVVGFLNQDRVAQAGLDKAENKEMWRQESAASMNGGPMPPLPLASRRRLLYTATCGLQLHSTPAATGGTALTRSSRSGKEARSRHG